MKHPGISVFLSLTGATVLSAAFLAAPAFADTYLELLSATKQQALALSEEEAGKMAKEALSYYTREEINNSIHLEADGSGMLSGDGAAVPVLMEDGNPNQVYEEAKQAVQEVKAEEDGQDPDNGQAQEEGQPAAAALIPAEKTEILPESQQTKASLMEFNGVRVPVNAANGKVTFIGGSCSDHPVINDQEQDPEVVDSQVFREEGADIMNIPGGYFRLPVKGLDK